MCFKKKIVSFSTGLVASPRDPRDIPLSAVQVPLRDLPETYFIPYKLRISYQNGFPHCCGYAAATVKESLEMREHNVIDFDGDYIYKECKKIDGMPNINGTWFRIALKVLKDTGAKPLNGTEPEKYKIGAYARVDDESFEGLKSAIYQNGAILSGFTGSNEGWQTAYVRPPKDTELKWGHAITLIGWNKDYIIGQNSWGTSWGDQGLFYIPKNYPVLEAWAVLTDLPNDLVINPKPQHTFNTDLQLNSRGEEVVWLQKCLKHAGVFPQVIDNTGFYGTITKRSVELFQSAYGLFITGKADINTRKKLNEIYA